MSNPDQPQGQEQAMLQQILNRMDKMTDEIGVLKADNKELRSALSDVQHENKKLHSTVSAMQNRDRELQNTIRKLRNELEAIEAEKEGQEHEIQEAADAPPQDELDGLEQRAENAGDDPDEVNSILTDAWVLLKKHKKTILVGLVGGAIGALLFAYGVPLVFGAAVVTTKAIAFAGVTTGGSTALLYDEVSRRKAKKQD